MSGLLMKDLELLKVNIKTYFIVFAVGIIYLFVQTDGSIFFISYMIFVSLSVTVGTISYDSYHHGMNFLMTLPFTRKEYVISKYLTAAGVTLAAGILSMIPGLLKAQSINARKEFLVSTGAVMICAGIFLAILLPMRLKYEIEKCRILMVALVAVIFLLAAGGKKALELYKGNAGLQFLNAFAGWQIAVAMIVVMVVCLVVSVKVSEGIMERKEF